MEGEGRGGKVLGGGGGRGDKDQGKYVVFDCQGTLHCS